MIGKRFHSSRSRLKIDHARTLACNLSLSVYIGELVKAVRCELCFQAIKYLHKIRSKETVNSVMQSVQLKRLHRTNSMESFSVAYPAVNLLYLLSALILKLESVQTSMNLALRILRMRTQSVTFQRITLLLVQSQVYI